MAINIDRFRRPALFAEPDSFPSLLGTLPSQLGTYGDTYEDQLLKASESLKAIAGSSLRPHGQVGHDGHRHNSVRSKDLNKRKHAVSLALCLRCGFPGRTKHWNLMIKESCSISGANLAIGSLRLIGGGKIRQTPGNDDRTVAARVTKQPNHRQSHRPRLSVAKAKPLRSFAYLD